MRGRQAFTVVELLVVAIILVTLAFVVVPRFSEAAGDARFASLQTTLQTVRARLALYRDEHAGRFPSLPRFAELMTCASNRDGVTSPAPEHTAPLGPYLQIVPLNPYTGRAVIGSGPPGSSDWFYDEQTGAFRANHDAAYAAF